MGSSQRVSTLIGGQIDLVEQWLEQFYPAWQSGAARQAGSHKEHSVSACDRVDQFTWKVHRASLFAHTAPVHTSG
jgi:hypothetical protein